MAYKKILFRRDTSSNWTSANPILSAGEIGLETNTNKIKLGDGSTAWNSLSYFYGSLDNTNLNDLGDVTITSAQNGDVLRWNGTAWVNDPINLATDTIGNYVDSLVAGTGVTLSNNSGEGATPTVAIGQSVATSASVNFARLETTGNVVVGGDLTVSGTTTTINSETLTINDNVIVLNNNATGAPTENAGIEVERGSSTNVSLRWNETTDNWELTNDGTNYLMIMDHGSLNDLNHDDHTQYMTNARHDAYDHSVAMGSVNLIDIGDVNVSASPVGNTFLRYNNGAWEETEISLGSNTTGDYVQSLYAGTGITITNNSGEGATPSIAIGQDVSTSATPTFTSVNANLTGNVTGNASTATTLQNSRSISLSGDVTGSVSFNGSSDVVISASIAENSIALGTDTTGNYMSDVTAGTGVTISHTPGEGSSASISIGQAVATSDSPTFAGATIDGIKIGITAANEIDTATGNLTLDSNGGTVQVDDNLLTTGTVTVQAASTQDSVILQGRAGGNSTYGVTVTPATLSSSQTLTLPNTTGTVVTTGDSGTVTSTMIADGTIVNGDINASAAIALSKLASGTAGQIIVTNASGVPTYVSESGDISIDADGVTSISSGVIVDADINASAAIADTKLATISTADKVSLSAINIDGGTDIGAALADADLFIVDDGGAGANRKAAATRVSDYVFGKVSGDISIASNGAATIAANSVALGTDTSGDYVSSLVAGTGVTLSNNSGESATPTVAIGQAVATSSSVTFAQLTTTGDVIVGGDLHVTGTTTTVNETNLAIQDTFIYLNDGSTITDPDLGIAGNYNDGTYRHAGIFSDASDSHKWKIFKGYTLEPTDPINTSHGSYTPATMVANTFESVVADGTAPISVSSSTVVTNLNADKLDGQDGSYYAPVNNASFTGTFSAPNGTITSTMIADGTIVDADINASAAITLSKLAAGTSGQIIVVNSSGVPTYVTETGDISISDTGVTAIEAGVIVNADVNASAAIAHSKLANATAGQVLIGTTTTGVITATTVSGDVTITGGGVTAIGSGVVVNADINASAAIDHSKLANITAGQVLLGNASNVPTATALSGDVTINSSGVTAIGSGVVVNADISSSAGIDLQKLADPATNSQIASYTLVLNDRNKIVEMNVGSANNLTVPANSSVAFPTGTQINILQTGSGQTTLVAAGGVTVNGTPGLKLRAQWSYVTLIKRATDTWVAVGDLSA